MKQLFFILILLITMSCATNKNEWNITDYGAKSDSLTISTDFIQTAINDCAEAGGGKVIIPEGIFVTGTIILKSNVCLHFQDGAILLGSINPNDYKSIDPFIDATGQPRGKCIISVVDAENVSITGNGTVDGRGKMFTVGNIKKTVEALNLGDNNSSLFERPFLVRLVRSKGISISGVKLMNPAAWTLHLYQCSNFKIDGIEIYSHANRNNDGIDIDSSSDGTIANCIIDSGDDAVCFKSTSPIPTQNVEVSDCKIKSNWGAIKFGTESMGDFRNITVKNCLLHDTRGGGIKILSVDGAVIEGVKIDNIKMDNVDMPLFIRLGERLRVYRNAPKQNVGSIKNLSISNITATTRTIEESRVSPPTGIFITGTPNHKIDEVKLSNIHITLPGGGTMEDAQKLVPEQETMYPEFNFFEGSLPAYGMFARHVESLSAENLTFSILSEDKRDEMVFDDAKLIKQ